MVTCFFPLKPGSFARALSVPFEVEFTLSEAFLVSTGLELF